MWLLLQHLQEEIHMLSFIFTDSESKTIKTSQGNRKGFDLVEIMHFL